jgi:hypothetical protein
MRGGHGAWFDCGVDHSLDLLRESCGVDASPELVVAVQSLSVAQLDDLVDDLLDRPWDPRPPSPSSEVWPLVNARTSTFTTGGSNRWYTGTAGPAGLNLISAIDPRSIGTGRFPAGVLRALLYSHGLVIEDPVLLAAEMYAGTSDETRPLARAAVEASVASTVEIAPLIDAGVVDTFFTPTAEQGDAAAIEGFILARLDDPDATFDIDAVWDSFEAAYVDGLSPPLQDLWRRVRGGDRSPPLELVAEGADVDVEVARVFIQVLSELRPRGVVENAVSVVASALADINRYGGRTDLLCPSRLFANLAFVGDPDPRHAARLHQLTDIEVPRLDELTVEDAVKIRQGSETFARWRTDLSMALERASRLQEELGPGVNARAVVAEVLASTREALLREVGRSRAMSGHGGLVSFVAGGLGGALGGSAGGALGAALGAAGGATTPLLQSVLTASSGIPAFLDRHYLLFEAPRAS